MKKILISLLFLELVTAMMPQSSFALNINQGRVVGPEMVPANRLPQCGRLIPAPTLEVTRVVGAVGRPTRLRAHVTRTGTPVAGRTVAFQVDSTDMGTAMTNAAGIATLNWTPTGLPKDAPITVRLNPVLCESIATGSTTSSIGAASTIEAGKIGGPTSFVEVRAATPAEAKVEAGMVPAEIAVRRSAFGVGTTTRNGSVPVSFATNGPGTPAPSPECKPGPWSCAPQALYAEAMLSGLNAPAAFYSISDRRFPPAMGGRSVFTTTTWDRDYQDAWDQCAMGAANNNRTAWGHNVFTSLPQRVGKLYEYTYPTQTTQTVNGRPTSTYKDEGAFRVRFIDVNITAHINCSE